MGQHFHSTSGLAIATSVLSLEKVFSHRDDKARSGLCLLGLRNLTMEAVDLWLPRNPESPL